MKTPKEIDDARQDIADALNTWCAPDHPAAASLLAMAMALNFADGTDIRDFSEIIGRIRSMYNAG